MHSEHTKEECPFVLNKIRPRPKASCFSAGNHDGRMESLAGENPGRNKSRHMSPQASSKIKDAFRSAS